jgi:hypothetical protein
LLGVWVTLDLDSRFLVCVATSRNGCIWSDYPVRRRTRPGNDPQGEELALAVPGRDAAADALANIPSVNGQRRRSRKADSESLLVRLLDFGGCSTTVGGRRRRGFRRGLGFMRAFSQGVPDTRSYRR